MRVAAIDCGTNAIRLLIADVDGDRLTDVTRRMEIVRLGEGVDRTGLLAPAAIERTRQALAGYAAEITAHDVGRVRMCATSASRDAANAADFHTMVSATLGVAPEVITGDEEARLSFLGAVHGLDAPPPYLVVDIGGGSTEFVTGHAAGDIAAAISVDIGCVRMTERHLHGDPPPPAEIAAAEADITAAVDRALAVVNVVGPTLVGPTLVGPTLAGPTLAGPTLVGLAGSVTTVAALAMDLPSYDDRRIHRARLEYGVVAKVTAGLLASSVAERRRLPVMHPGRADVIGAGAMILRIVMERSGIRTVVVSEHDILDGIAFGLTS